MEMKGQGDKVYAKTNKTVIAVDMTLQGQILVEL